MSTLWTPGGEHPVDPENESSSDFSELSPEEQEQAEALAAEMAAVREQLAAAPAEIVVANHLMGLYELAAIHLSQQPPKMDEASLAIDAMSAVLDSLEGRLGEAEGTLKDALHQIRLAYVQVGNQESTPDE
ncbi:MAG: hypothetical protein CL517_02225 [Actinobacteria bacterium]|nr:hypothetical protein [Actinomycetota bacterium]MEC7810640.1 hypothetical protein [Actinomycetota bacterium]MED5277010.1 hypothetical protein [Actinomycetota bacterium]|tara:strand:+ start:267 stop:659 length:393 start_codon:yes stop_codon:yes gene_type:complete